jgi:two-component system, cell cycle sensor histidine kinase and response regulator CckA
MPFFIRQSTGHDDAVVPEIDSVWHDLLDAVPAMIWISDLEGRLLRTNSAWMAATGMSVDDYDHDAAWILVHPDDHNRLSETAAGFNGQPVSFEYRMRQADGTYSWVLERIQPWRNKAGVQLGYIGSAINIQNQKEHEQLLAITALRQTSLSYFSRVAMQQELPAVVNCEALRLLCEHLQLPAALLVLKDPDTSELNVTATTGLSPDSAPPVLAPVPPSGVVLDYPQDGSVFPIALTWLRENGWSEAISVPLDPEHPDLGCMIGLRNQPGPGPIGPLHYARDLVSILALSHTWERAQRKLIQGEQRAHQVQKMEAVGLLAGGVAHDFNNLLTAIRCFAELLRDDLSDTAQRTRVDDILHASSRASHLVRQLLAFSRQDVSQPEPLDLNTVVDDLRGFIRSLFSEHVAIVVDLHEGPAWCQADRKQLEQVLFNLCLNARDAMVTDGTLTLRVTVDSVAHRVRLSVSDSGSGIPVEVRDKIFQPFYSTKARGRGTGLGLPTSLGIVRSFGGELTFETESGRGTVFHLDLPEIADPLASLDETQETKSIHRPSHILLVEDDELVRTVTRMMAESLGHRVTVFGDSCEASSWAQINGLDDIDLLVTDIVMPGINGYELSRRLHEVQPTLRVLYMSGYVDDEAALEAMIQPGVFFLPKPFSSEEFANKLATALQPA